MKPAKSARHPAPQLQPDKQRSRHAPRDVAVLIPAYQPTVALEELVDGLVYAGVPAILLVDDGSSSAHRSLFDRLALEPQVHLLRHAGNQGKGAALKTGIRYFLDHLAHWKGLVTAGADGQHAAADVVRLARALHQSPRRAVLGARSFRLAPHPGLSLASVLGNRLAAALFSAVTRISLSDAQSGLRALPATLLPRLLDLPGSGHEYEMSALLYIARTLHPLAEQPIRTLGRVGTPESHFRPLADWLRLLRALLSRPAYAPLEPVSRPRPEPEFNPIAAAALRAK